MREIKFRAWDKSDKIMHLPSISEVGIDFEGLIYYSGADGHQRFRPEYQDRFVVMQFTGLKDKDGVEIYEGDIMEVRGGVSFVVYMLIGFRFNSHLPGGYMSDLYGASQIGKVIGNIYENPELVK